MQLYRVTFEINADFVYKILLLPLEFLHSSAQLYTMCWHSTGNWRWLNCCGHWAGSAAASCVGNSRDPLSQAQPQCRAYPIHLSTFKLAGGLFPKTLSRHPLFGFLSGSALCLREAGLIESADCSLPQDCWACLFEVTTSDLGTLGLK